MSNCLTPRPRDPPTHVNLTFRPTYSAGAKNWGKARVHTWNTDAYGYIRVTYEYIRVTYIRIQTRFSTDVADIHEIKLLQYRDVFSSGIDHTSNTRIHIRVQTNIIEEFCFFSLIVGPHGKNETCPEQVQSISQSTLSWRETISLLKNSKTEGW